MTYTKPSFKQRCLLLEGTGQVVQAEAERTTDAAAHKLLSEAADTIFTEVEEMKRAIKRFEARNAQRAEERKAKTGTSPEPALTN